MLRSTPLPTIGLGRPLLAALGAVLIPAIPAFFALWGSEADVDRILIHADSFRHMHWLLAAALSSAALFAWIIVPIATPFIWVAVRFGWAGPLGMVLLGLAIGLPGTHIVFNGDLTTEATGLLHIVVLTLSIQALCGWAVLRLTCPRPPAANIDKENASSP